MPDLKPCPFCGKTPDKIYKTSSIGFLVVLCGNDICPIFDIPMPVEAWNTRPDPENAAP